MLLLYSDMAFKLAEKTGNDEDLTKILFMYFVLLFNWQSGELSYQSLRV